MFEKARGIGSHRPDSLKPGFFPTLPCQRLSWAIYFSSNIRTCFKRTVTLGICQGRGPDRIEGVGARTANQIHVDNDSDSMSQRAREIWLAVIAALSFLAYWLLVSVSLSPHLSVVHNVPGTTYGGPLTWPAGWLHLSEAKPEVFEIIFLLLIVILSALWFLAIYLVRRDNRKVLSWIIAGAFGLFAVLFVVGPAFQSSDVFSYIFSGRAMSVYHSNPYTIVPRMKPHDVFFPLVGWKDNGSVYGPVFTYLSYGITKVAGNGIWANVLGFKLLALASYAACLPLVYHLARRVSPGRENMALAIAAWCPVLLMHVAGGGHNDMLAVAFVLGGYLLYRKGYLLTGVAVVAIAMAVKLTAALALAPIFVLYVRDRSGAPLKRFVAGSLTCIAAFAIPYIGFWDGTRVLKDTRQVASMYSSSSVPSLISHGFQKVLMASGMTPLRAETLANNSVRLLFLGIMLTVAIFLLRGVKDFRSMALCAASLALLWILASTYILPWYIALGVMVVAFTGWNLTTGLTIGTASVLALYRLPESVGAPGSPTIYIALPLALILLGWAFLAQRLRWQRKIEISASAGSVDIVETAVPEE